MSIKIDPDDNTYDLGELRLEKEVIVCEDFNVEFGSESETRSVTSSRDPVGYKGSKNEYKWEANVERISKKQEKLPYWSF